MDTNVLRALENIAAENATDLRVYSDKSLIRINRVGELLEYYVKEAFAGTFNLPRNQENDVFKRLFSYQGDQNHFPDLMISGGDAIEIKKHERQSGIIALNSSPPRAMLYRDDSFITEECRNSDGGNWVSRDLFYGVGTVTGGKLKTLHFAQGKCFVKGDELYSKIHKTLKDEVEKSIDKLNLKKSKTKELGRVKEVDPLCLSDLRVRGMWQIVSPSRHFGRLLSYNQELTFQAAAIMTIEKYNEMRRQLSDFSPTLLGTSFDDLNVQFVDFPDPNEPTNILKGALVKVEW